MFVMLLPIVLYWILAKSMDWGLRFYVAAPLFVVLDTIVSMGLNRLLGGAWPPLDLLELVVHMCVALPLFYLLERYSDSDDLLAWPLLFGVGAVVVVFW